MRRGGAVVLAIGALALSGCAHRQEVAGAGGQSGFCGREVHPVPTVAAFDRPADGGGLARPGGSGLGGMATAAVYAVVSGFCVAGR